MGEALPEGATQSMEELDHGSPDMGGFTLSFMIPFERTEVYDELLVDDNPLGSSPNVAYTILRPGYDGEAMSPGCVRRVEFAAPFYGETTSELMVCDRGPDRGDGVSQIIWRQLESSTRLNLLGHRGYYPEFGVVLEGGPGGTLVTMRYNFAKADMKGPLCFLAKCMPDLLKWHLHGSIGSVWHMEMVRRGKVPIKRPQFGNIVADRSEEEQIRLKAQLPRDKFLGIFG